jgi:hypothetical protein
VKRGGRLPQQSPKRRSEAAERAAVVERTAARAGYQCEAAELVPEVDCCPTMGFDVDEIKSRGVNPGGHLDDSNTQLLCRCHHRWRTEHPDEAHRRGLRLKGWETQRAGVVCTGTLGRMCRAIEFPDGRWFYSAQSMLIAGHNIPGDTLEAATLDADTGERFELDTCFCCVDPAVILDGLGFRYALDPFLGNLIVVP